MRGDMQKLQHELEQLPRFRDFDCTQSKVDAKLGDMRKEMSLFVSLKELSPLLDQKVNVADINNTLGVIQSEVERCVRDEDLKKSLNE